MIPLHARISDLEAYPVQYSCRKNAEILSAAGFTDFEDFWNIPHDFVEDINHRRNGWSGVSLLTTAGANGEKCRFYVKRQENQLRYSWRHLFGALTFLYEIEAIRTVTALRLPAVELAAYGFRTSGGVRQGVLVTCAIETPCFARYEKNPPDWPNFLPQLRIAGQQLCRLHARGWQHGAFYPAHLFVNSNSGHVRLIDFERARQRSQPIRAAEADFIQFFRRSHWIPDEVLAALLESYRVPMAELFKRLAIRFPERIDILKE